MLGTFVKNLINGDANDTFIITFDHGGILDDFCHTNFSENVSHPLCLGGTLQNAAARYSASAVDRDTSRSSRRSVILSQD